MTQERKPPSFLPTHPPRDVREEILGLRAQIEVLVTSVVARLDNGAATISGLRSAVDKAQESADAANAAAVAAAAPKPFPWKIFLLIAIPSVTAAVSLAGMLASVPTRSEVRELESTTRGQVERIRDQVGDLSRGAIEVRGKVDLIQREQAEQAERGARLESKVDQLINRRTR